MRRVKSGGIFCVCVWYFANPEVLCISRLSNRVLDGPNAFTDLNLILIYFTILQGISRG